MLYYQHKYKEQYYRTFCYLTHTWRRQKTRKSLQIEDRYNIIFLQYRKGTLCIKRSIIEALLENRMVCF